MTAQEQADLNLALLPFNQVVRIDASSGVVWLCQIGPPLKRIDDPVSFGAIYNVVIAP